MSIRLLAIAILCVFTAACASVPGKWEQFLRSKGAPNAIIVEGRDCDSATVTGCLHISNYILQTYGDPIKAQESAQEACDLGNVGGCTAVGMLKKRGSQYQRPPASGGH